jgi:hypothetical protein
MKPSQTSNKPGHDPVADIIEVERQRRGHLPTWFRRRDAVAAYVSKLGGRKMSNRTLRRLTLVADAGIPELQHAMDHGRITIAAAAELARLPSEYQQKALANPTLRRSFVRILRSKDDEDNEKPEQRCRAILK